MAETRSGAAKGHAAMEHIMSERKRTLGFDFFSAGTVQRASGAGARLFLRPPASEAVQRRGTCSARPVTSWRFSRGAVAPWLFLALLLVRRARPGGAARVPTRAEPHVCAGRVATPGAEPRRLPLCPGDLSGSGASGAQGWRSASRRRLLQEGHGLLWRFAWNDFVADTYRSLESASGLTASRVMSLSSAGLGCFLFEACAIASGSSFFASFTRALRSSTVRISLSASSTSRCCLSLFALPFMLVLPLGFAEDVVYLALGFVCSGVLCFFLGAEELQEFAGGVRGDRYPWCLFFRYTPGGGVCTRFCGGVWDPFFRAFLSGEALAELVHGRCPFFLCSRFQSRMSCCAERKSSCQGRPWASTKSRGGRSSLAMLTTWRASWTRARP